MERTDDAAPEDDAAPDNPPKRIPQYARRPISSPSDEFLDGARHGGQAFAEGGVCQLRYPTSRRLPPGRAAIATTHLSADGGAGMTGERADAGHAGHLLQPRHLRDLPGSRIRVLRHPESDTS